MRLSTERLSLSYNGRDAVHEVTLDLESGELIAIVGPNGSGKTTLLRGLSRLLRPVAGHVLLDGDDIRAISSRSVARRLAVLPQEHPEGVDITVNELVWRGRAPHQGILQRATPADHEAVDWALEAADVHHIAGRPLGSLSGGERQRAWIALALAQQPRVLLLDEPTSFLVVHDLALAGRFMQRVIGMRDGRIAFDGPSREVLRPEPLEEVFGVPMLVLEDPESGLPVPLPRHPKGAVGPQT